VKRSGITDEKLEPLRAICLRFPEAVEAGGVGDPSWKVRDKIFAMQHGHADRPSVWFKAPPGVQELLVGAEPARFFRPPYVGHAGWVGAWLDVEIDWEELADFVEESYRITAPKRLSAQLDDAPA
jgi:predicted DNA-binding protein (MmcQ/YjbR family)